MRTIASDDRDTSTDLGRAANVYCFRHTEKAILIRYESGAEQWIPQSVIHDDSEVCKTGDRGELVVKAWFAEKLTPEG